MLPALASHLLLAFPSGEKQGSNQSPFNPPNAPPPNLFPECQCWPHTMTILATLPEHFEDLRMDGPNRLTNSSLPRILMKVEGVFFLVSFDKKYTQG